MTSLPLSCSQFSPSRQNSLFFTKFSSNLQTRPQQFQVGCNAQNDKNTPHLDRRNLLVGMGGLYGTASNLDSPAFATPISAPDLSKCTRGDYLIQPGKPTPLDVDCCPPPSDTIIDYKLDPVTTLRVRPAAHLAGKEYIAKYEKAVSTMKACKADNPISFTQQANVHCAYCNLTYPQTGDPDVKLQIHYSWLFFTWHRWYLYFYERILGKLIGDPTFALPFWNWDNPEGMTMPGMFNNEGSSLYDANRNQCHRPGNGFNSTVNLRYAGPDQPIPTSQTTIDNNLEEVYMEVVGAKSQFDFYGAKYVTGTKAEDSGAGTVERGSHTAVHWWVGDPNQKNNEDMGNFYSSGRDPLFFSHHANVDRLWSVYSYLHGSPSDQFTNEWLDANFLFYDENKRLVRVRVGDGLDIEKMGYNFQKVDQPWLNYKKEKPKTETKLGAAVRSWKVTDNPVFPLKLDKVVKVLVDRPKKSRSREEKEKEEELLVIQGIEVDSAKFVRFEVYVNDKDEVAEYAGCYSQVPHKSSGEPVMMKSKIRLGLSEVLEVLDADDDDLVFVSLVPQAGGEHVIIGGIKIIYVDVAGEQ